jgi:hypothetical protein
MDTISHSSTEDDISLYISCELSDVKGMELWKASADLAGASDGLFEWARLACAYIKGYNNVGLGVHKRVDAVIASDKDTRVPLLDSMYKLTLETILPAGIPQRSIRLDEFRSAMTQIINTAEPLPLPSLASMRCQFADKALQQIDVEAVIQPMGALLSGTTDPSAAIRPLHASFPEFWQMKVGVASSPSAALMSTMSSHSPALE